MPISYGRLEETMETDLDKLSNSVIDEIEAKNYDEAEKLCQRLLLEFPTVVDGRERMGMVREAQGRFKEAADEYSKALEMIKLNPDAADKEMIQYITEQRDEALAKAKA